MKLRSLSGVWKPTVEEAAKKLAGPCEISNLSLSAGGGATVVSLYDGSSEVDANDSNLKWVLDASTADNDSAVFPMPLVFKKGVYAVCEQGAGFNPRLSIARVDYSA